MSSDPGSGGVDPPERIRRKQVEVDRLWVDERIWGRQQVSLAGGESERANDLELLTGLDPFRHQDHVPAIGEVAQRLQHRVCRLTQHAALNEREIDLDDVE